jgi:ATP-dependent helicase YprA (DUF1998 family)
MNVFKLRNRLVSDYASYISSFIQIRDERIRHYVDHQISQGLLWPDPLIQLNPSFEPGKLIDELVEEGVLHTECKKIFRIKPDPKSNGNPLRLHRHQEEAIRIARGGNNYVLTTGTGSGKSLAYIIPIVDHVLHRGSGRGIQAIVVYPMNALANSQLGELRKFLCHGYPDGKGPVTFERYTGQESDEDRKRIMANPPDILLTNYVMLELILTRPSERGTLVRAANDLQFLVLDELHTYRGRQGSDVAMLVRRVREALNAKRMQCVGTSATLAGAGTYQEQQEEIAKVASTFFGAEVIPDHVIGETLQRGTPEFEISEQGFLDGLRERISKEDHAPPLDFNGFINDPLSVWIESKFGVTKEPTTSRLIRAKPRSITGPEGVARELSQAIDLPEERCVEAIEGGLLAGYQAEDDPETGFPVFAFRLNQFISRGDTVYATVEAEEARHVTVFGQQFLPGDRNKILLPLVFCRECGQEYYCVRKSHDDETDLRYFIPRELGDTQDDELGEAGFLYFNTTNPWPIDAEEELSRLPDDWLEDHHGTMRVRRNRRKNLPNYIRIESSGRESDDGIDGHYLSAPFRFCLQCGVAYDFRQRSDFAKLSELGAGGRSTATTILSMSTIRGLQEEVESGGLPEKARKLLSFTDNRQDAALQAGHFNDFIEVSVLRAAIYQAASTSGNKGITHETLTQMVFDALNLPIDLYANDPEVRFQARNETDKALRDVLGYRIYRDLRRGWRVTSPNLEQYRCR